MQGGRGVVMRVVRYSALTVGLPVAVLPSCVGFNNECLKIKTGVY